MVAIAREIPPYWTVSHLKDQVRIIQQEGIGRFYESSSLNMKWRV